ncbi:hypothetical protein NUW54_g14639 [Trametes sanguinea]|uniref:Uncharacterized protein n=1 Tax=Trametes sanguinea TaxID=158606 RepID=A0ACC1MC46_9APHY|nr:hypothetical protein NUW54_g14639 [Trametes sanguinea]
MRGFGVEIPEEEEPPEGEDEEGPAPAPEDAQDEAATESVVADTSMASAETETDMEVEQDGLSTVAQSRMHSRHVSKLSVALSLRSVGGMAEPGTILEDEIVPARSPSGELEIEDVDPDQEAVGEWTGSEDLQTAETSDDESIGEYSNPSDEERARQERMHRRMLRRVKQVKQELEIPRRIPNFPRPPSLPVPVPADMGLNPDDDIISNPIQPQRDRSSSTPAPALAQWLAVLCADRPRPRACALSTPV